MQFIDTHTHVTDEAFPSIEEQDAFVSRALDAGVGRMLLADIRKNESASLQVITNINTPCSGCIPAR